MPSQIECEEAIARILEYLDGELDAAAERQVERHLETCRGCFGRAGFERRLRHLVAETGIAPTPESLRQRARDLMKRF